MNKRHAKQAVATYGGASGTGSTSSAEEDEDGRAFDTMVNLALFVGIGRNSIACNMLLMIQDGLLLLRHKCIPCKR